MQRVLRFFVIVPLLILAVGCSRDPESRANRLISSGNKFFDQGKFKEASMQYRRAIQQNPKSGAAYYHLGLTSLKLGDLSTAASAFRRTLDTNKTPAEIQDSSTKLADIFWLAYVSDNRKFKSLLPEIDELSKKLLQSDPKSFDGLRLEGYLDLAGGTDAAKPDIEAALAKFRQAAAAKPYNPELSLIIVQTLLASRQPAEAEKTALDYLNHDKKFAPMYDQLITMYLTTGRRQDAEKLLRDKVDNNPKQEMFYLALAAYYMLEKRPADMESALQRLVSNPKDFPMAHLSLGRFFFRARDYDRAGREYEEGIKAAPKDKAIYQKAQVELLATQEKYAEARVIVDQVLKNDPKDSQAIQLRSALQLKTGDPNEIKIAVNELQALVTKNPQNAYYRLQLGQALLAGGQPEQARTHLEEATRLRPDITAPKSLLAQILIDKKEHARALQLAEDVIRVEPQNIPAHLLRSAALINLGEREKAKAELDNVVRANPRSADAKYQLGRLSFDEKNYKAAEAFFNEMRELAPGDNRSIMGLVETKMSENDSAAAVKLLEDQIAKDPKRLDMRLALANILVRAEKYDDAIRYFKELVQANPKSGFLFLELAETYRRKGDLNAAIDNFRVASSLAPSDADPLIRLAMLLDGLGRRDEAKPIYERVLRLNPDQGVALNNLAYIKAEEGTDLDAALSLAERAKQKFPVDPNIADTLGWIYIKKNLSEDAVKVFTDLVAKSPKNATYRYHLAMALFQKGDRPKAKRECDTALQSNPTKEEAGKIRSLIQKIG